MPQAIGIFRYGRCSRKIDQHRGGEHKDLYESYGRLMEQNLIENLDDNIYLTWIEDDDNCRHTSTLLKVAAINTKLDSEGVPDEIIDTIIYEAICNIRAGQRDFRKEGGIGYDWNNLPTWQWQWNGARRTE